MNFFKAIYSMKSQEIIIPSLLCADFCVLERFPPPTLDFLFDLNIFQTQRHVQTVGKLSLSTQC